jgi:hypothetical protein
MIPLFDVLSVLAERPPADRRDEIWILDSNVRDEIPRARHCDWLTVARRCLSLVTNSTFVEGIEQTRGVIDLLRSSANPDGRRDIALHVLRPRQELSGSLLDFDPAKLRRWYMDGVRTARQGETLRV